MFCAQRLVSWPVKATPNHALHRRLLVRRIAASSHASSRLGGRCFSTQHQQDAETKEVVEPLTRGQVVKVASASGVGMVGFGFVDNFVMITAGDLLDASFGATLGVSTMCAAGLGNLFSDVVGHYTGDYIEQYADRLGFEEPELTDAQKELRAYREAQRHGGAIGLVIGCTLGMCPLLWTGRRHHRSLTKEQQELYAAVFGPNGVPPETFLALLALGSWKSGVEDTKIVEQGKPLKKVVLLVKGVCEARKANWGKVYKTDSTRKEKKVGVYVAKLSECPEGKTNRGDIIGGGRVGEKLMSSGEAQADFSSKPYGNAIVAQGDIQYIEWDLDELVSFCEKEAAARNVFCSKVFRQLRVRVNVKSLQSEDVEHRNAALRHVVQAVVADGVVSDAERKLVSDLLHRFELNDMALELALELASWNLSDWDLGYKQTV